MTTELQSQSNARNARHSTGPVSAEGKARASRNALKHGFCAADIVMPGEDDGAFADLLRHTLDTWQPDGRDERELADEIAVATWRRWRLRRAEGELWAVRCGSGPDALLNLGEAVASDCDSTANAIEKLRRWWQGNERHLHRCTERLRLMKRLAEQGVTRRARAPNPGALHPFVDAAINRPLPGQLPDGSFPESVAEILAAGPPAAETENGNSAEPTQSNESQPDQDVGGAEAEPAPAVSRTSPGMPLSRSERRRQERQQRKLARQATRQAAGG